MVKKIRMETIRGLNKNKMRELRIMNYESMLFNYCVEEKVPPSYTVFYTVFYTELHCVNELQFTASPVHSQILTSGG
jgi:hypothetical protein